MKTQQKKSEKYKKKSQNVSHAKRELANLPEILLLMPPKLIKLKWAPCRGGLTLTPVGPVVCVREAQGNNAII